MNRTRTVFLAAVFAILPLALSAQTEIRDSLLLEKAYISSPAEMLRGKVSGVRVSSLQGGVNGAISTNIRGINSVRSGSHPLWIIDGVVVNSSLDANREVFFQYPDLSYASSLNAFSYLNPYDIESIEVLKDVSATALYGIRGADGVIIVKTSKPQKEGLDVRWNSDLAYEEGATGIGHRHTLNISSGIRQTKYMVSAWYRGMQGALKPDNSGYGGLRAIFETRTNKTFWFGMNFAASMGESSSAAGPARFGQGSMTLALRNPAFFEKDTFDAWKADYDDNSKEYRLTNAVWLTINFTKTLSLNTTVGVDFQNHTRYMWYGDALSFGERYNGAAGMGSSQFFNYNAAAELSWKTYLASLHRLELSASVEAAGEYTAFNLMNGTNFFTKELRAKGLSLAGSKPVLHKYNHDHFNFGLVGKAAYAFRDIVGFNGSVRADMTPRYDRSFNLYGGANLWLDLRNAFFRDSDAVSSLRLKGGYGQAGREQYVPYALYGSYAGLLPPAVEKDVEMFYEGLNRVRSIEYNAGIEMGFFKNRLTLEAGWFDKQSADVFSSWCFGEKKGNYWQYASPKPQFRYSSLLENRGFEAGFSAVVLKNRDWELRIDGNASYIVNQMLRVDAADEAGQVLGGGASSVNANVVGYPAGSFVGFLLNEDGSLKDLIPDGVVNQYDKTVIGNPIPKVFGGFGVQLRWRGLVFDAQADGAAGFDILNLNKLLFEGGGGPYVISQSCIEKGDFLKIRRLSLAYDIPLRGIRFLKGIAVRFSALNPVTFTSYSGYNPEVNCFGTSTMSAGIDYGSFPVYRQYVLGLTVKF